VRTEIDRTLQYLYSLRFSIRLWLFRCPPCVDPLRDQYDPPCAAPNRDLNQPPRWLFAFLAGSSLRAESTAVIVTMIVSTHVRLISFSTATPKA
jgi:hypothetical protein